MSKRQDYWKKQGYTQEQINCHLEYERMKAKQVRERRKKNNEKNQELIKQIKKDIVGKTFGEDTIISISPTIDGIGFWFKTHKIFRDGSEGDFRYFAHFNDYSKEEFINNLKYL